MREKRKDGERIQFQAPFQFWLCPPIISQLEPLFATISMLALTSKGVHTLLLQHFTAVLHILTSSSEITISRTKYSFACVTIEKSIVGTFLRLYLKHNLVLLIFSDPCATSSVYQASIHQVFPHSTLFTVLVPAADWLWGLCLLSDLRLRSIFPAGNTLHTAGWL